MRWACSSALVFAGRDKISLDARAGDAGGDEDFLTGQSEGVFDLGLGRRDAGAGGEYDEDDGEEGTSAAPAKTAKRPKKKLPTLQRGRFAKTSSDEESASGSGSDSDADDAEGWGRSYYSRPSTRREREERLVSGEDAERRDEERALELAEVKRLQRRMREAIRGEADWGLDAVGRGDDGEGEDEDR